MHSSARSWFDRTQLQRWLALPLALALGGLLVGLLFAFLPASGAAAAPPAELAAAYSCSEAGLDSALAAGGSATFTCGAPTTVTVSARKSVTRNVTLAGANKLTLSGGSLTGVFSVSAGVHLTLLDLTIVDGLDSGGLGGAIYNGGHLTVTNSLFVNNSAFWGSVLFNAPGAAAFVSDSRFYYNSGFDGGLTNGSPVTTSAPASLIVANSVFSSNNANLGAAILNISGSVTITGATFYQNLSFYGGAIYDFARLSVDQSQFINNIAQPFVAADQRQFPAQAGSPALPASAILRGGGAIGIADNGSVLVANTAFTSNFGLDTGGAIFFGTAPMSSSVVAQTGSLTILNSHFYQNCTAGLGGAVSTAFATTILDSLFSQNLADAGGGCLLGLASQASPQAPAGGRAPQALDPGFIGIGGAIYNAGSLRVAGTAFVSNTATLTATAGGGGAIQNGIAAIFDLSNSTLTGNTAKQDGGAIYNGFGARATVIGTSFTHNIAISSTGGALTNRGELTVTNSLFLSNGGAPGGGGAISSDIGLLAALGPAGPNGPGGQAPPQMPAGQGPPQGLHIANSTFVANTSEYEGGAIDAGRADILASTFTSNTAAFGGAIDILSEKVTISGSTFIANAAVDTTYFSAGQGGAIDTNNFQLSVLNSTFFANAAAANAVGGAVNVDGGGVVTITNSTLLSNTAAIAANGGAFSNAGSTELHNTLVAFNGTVNCASAVTLNGANLEFPGTTCGGASIQTDPLALAPANNGGPTFTSALLPGSPAIDVAASDNGCPAADQRGAQRPVGPHCDIGAFEFGGQVPRLWLPLVRK